MNSHVTLTRSAILGTTGHVGANLPCLHCGYDLRTQPVTGRCPQCGHLVAETTADHLTALDRQGHVASDLPCLDCGYNLRTQPATGLCPECGAPVARSALGHYLHLASPQWVRCLANGALLLVIVLCTVGGVSILADVVAFPPATIGWPATPVIITRVLPPAPAVVIVVTGLWFIIRGLVCLTAPEPAKRFRPDGFTAGKLVRYGLAALPVAILASIGLTVLQARTSLWGVTFSPAMFLLSVLAAVVQIVFVLATLRHIAALMSRVPRRGLVLFAKIEFWSLLIAGLLYAGAASTFLPIAVGPTMPVPAYAGGPNYPAAVTASSAPALTTPSYTPTVPGTVTYTGPGGVTITTTVATFTPVGPGVASPFGRLHVLLMTILHVSSRALLCVFIAGLGLLFLVQQALAKAARLAKALALPEYAVTPDHD